MRTWSLMTGHLPVSPSAYLPQETQRKCHLNIFQMNTLIQTNLYYFINSWEIIKHKINKILPLPVFYLLLLCHLLLVMLSFWKDTNIIYSSLHRISHLTPKSSLLSLSLSCSLSPFLFLFPSLSLISVSILNRESFNLSLIVLRSELLTHK